MKRIKMFILLFFSIALVGCAQSNIEVFRFVNHEIEIKVGEEAILNLIYGEYSEDSEVQYTLSDDNDDDIVELNDGVVIGLQVGEVTIRATIDGIKEARMIVRVLQEEITYMKINADNDHFENEGSMQLSVDVYPSHLSNDVIWEIEENEANENIAEISEDGLLTVKNVSEPAKIVVVAKSNFDPKILCKKAFYVKYLPTEVLNIKANTNQLAANGSLNLFVTAHPITSMENLKIETNKPDILWVEENFTLKAVDQISRTEVVIITCTTWDGAESTFRVTVRK